MRRLLFAVAAVTLVGCGSPLELRNHAQQHAELARGAAESGDYRLARKEQAKAQHFYDRAAVRAWETRQPVPPPPQTPPVSLVPQY